MKIKMNVIIQESTNLEIIMIKICRKIYSKNLVVFETMRV